MAEPLTSNTNVTFDLCFKYPLAKGYTFKEMGARENKEFQKFLDCTIGKNADVVNKQYGRVPDKTDKYNNMQVYHYEVSKKFRIHVILENGHYIVIRLDCNHEIHK